MNSTDTLAVRTALSRRARFYAAIRRRWQLILVAIPVIVICAFILQYGEVEEGPFLTCLQVLPILAALYILFWLFCCIAVPVVHRRLKKIITGGGTAGATKPVGSSRMLSFAERSRAWWRLHTLRQTSDYCFREPSVSYLRIQALEPSAMDGVRMEQIRPWSSDGPSRVNYRLRCTVGGVEELAILSVERIVSKSGQERVYAYWTPPGANPTDTYAAETVELAINEPVIFSYGIIEEKNGVETPGEEMLCTITWIRG